MAQTLKTTAVTGLEGQHEPMATLRGQPELPSVHPRKSLPLDV